MSDTDRARRLADLIMRIRKPRRRKVLSALYHGMANHYRELPKVEGGVASLLGDIDLGEPDLDDDEPSQSQLDALQARLDAAGVESPFDLEETDTSGFSLLLEDAENVLDQEPGDAESLIIANAMYALYDLTVERKASTDPLDQLIEEQVTAHLED